MGIVARQKLLRLLARNHFRFSRLLAENRFFVEDLIHGLNWLYEKGYLKVEDGKLIPTRYLSFNDTKLLGGICPRCKGKGIELKAHKRLLQKFRKIAKHRPSCNLNYLQDWILPSDVIARVAFMQQNLDLEGKSVLIIGDDDLLSIAIGLTNLAKKVVVLEIDERICDFINRVAKREKLNVEAFEYDVAHPLPTEFKRKFEVFSCEPLETRSGFLAFISRGAAGLKRNGVAYVGISVFETPPRLWHEFELFMLKMGFVITHLIQNFSYYVQDRGEDSRAEIAYIKSRLKFPVKEEVNRPWYSSALLRAIAIGLPRPLISANKRMRIRTFYDYELSPKTLKDYISEESCREIQNELSDEKG